MAGFQLAMDYRTPYTTTSLTLANVDPFSKSGMLAEDGAQWIDHRRVSSGI